MLDIKFIRENVEVVKRTIEKKNAKDKIQDMKIVSQKIDEIDKKVVEIQQKIDEILYLIPNIPHSSVPIGPDASANKVVKTWGKARSFDWTPLTHIELAQELDIIDFPRASKITG